MVTAFTYMASDDGQIWESFHGHCIAKPSMDLPNRIKWPLHLRTFQRQNGRIFSRSLTFGKKVLSAWPRWIQNPPLPVASSGPFIEIVPDFWKMTGKVSDGPTSYAILQQVLAADLEPILTDFIKERLRHTHLGGSGGHAPPGNFWIFYSLKPPHSWVSESFRQDISKCSTWNFFSIQNICIYDRFS